MYLIEVSKKDRVTDAEGNDARHGIADLQLRAETVRVDQVYMLEGRLAAGDLRRIAESVLTDPIIEDFTVRKAAALPKQRPFRDAEKGPWSVLKTFHHGVTDNVGQTTLEAIRNLGIGPVAAVTTGKRYRIGGPLPFGDARKIATRLLANPLIESCVIEKDRMPRE
jgi:phosphoribosylformylglycinamidine (FGAM) synthase PurS component